MVSDIVAKKKRFWGGRSDGNDTESDNKEAKSVWSKMAKSLSNLKKICRRYEVRKVRGA